jgi:AbrB family looped-hinge helix DNA binding protein
MTNHTNSELVDMVTLGERGQIVIPQAMRERLGLAAGDKLMVFLKHDRVIGLVSQEACREWVTQLTQQLSQLDNQPTPKPQSTKDHK